jgi:hypothetical protein
MRAAQEYDESNRDNRQGCNHNKIDHRGALNHRVATLVNGVHFNQYGAIRFALANS